MKIEVGKFYKTRDGKKVRIYATDAENTYSIHGAVKYDKGWCQECWTEEGYYDQERHEVADDIIAEWVEEETRTVWLNVYDDYVFGRYRKSDSNYDTHRDVVACVPVTFTFKKGDGL